MSNENGSVVADSVVADSVAVVEPVVVSTPVVADVVATEPVVAPVATKAKRVRKPKVEPVVEPVAPAKRVRKPKVVKVGRGRPVEFTGDLLKGIVKLLRKHKNATHVRAILGASGKKSADLVALREASGLTEKVAISMPTLLGIKAKAGIVGLGKGRPKKAA
jgi:hypothetical protein